MFRWLIFILIIFIAGIFFGRQWFDSILLQNQHQAVHEDNSHIKTSVQPQVRPQVELIYQNQNGEMVRVLADAERYSEFVQQSSNALEQVRKNLLQQSETELHNALTGNFDAVRERVNKFADWYFAYSTTYKILWKATTSVAEHAVSFSGKDLSDSVAHEVEQYILKYYEDIVLRPELTNPKLKQAYQNTLTSVHHNYVNALSMLHANFLTFVSKETTHTQQPDAVDITLDWHSQFNKMNMAAYEKTPEGKALGAVLIAGGASVGGKIMGGVAAKSAAGAASKGLLSKLASPFASKAIIIGGSGAVGSIGGPVGAGIGAGVGLGLDYLINEGVEVMQREEFIKDVNEAITATQTEWEIVMQQSLQQAIEVLINDAIQLLPSYEQSE
jgi:hypothetical protein